MTNSKDDRCTIHENPEDGLSLSHLHEVPYSNIEGAQVHVTIDKTTVEESTGGPVTHKETIHRAGRIVGRGEGRGVAYDSGSKTTKPTSIGPSIYLDTPEDTILEVRTDKAGNKLTMFDPDDE